MIRNIGLIFLGYRVLLFAFFLALSFEKQSTQRALLIVPSAVYLSMGMYVFLYPGRLRLFKNYGDLFFIPTLVFLSGQKESVLALLPPIALYSNRKVFTSILFLWLSIGFCIYYYGSFGLMLIPSILALFITSLHPDLVEALRKERFYIRNLRKAHSELLSDYSRIEKSVEELSLDGRLLDRLENSRSLEDYLKAIKEEFGLRLVSVSALRGNFPEESLIDKTNNSIHVPVRLERGNVWVTFQLNSPLELHDRRLIKRLERAGKLVNLFIEGFEETPQVKVIAV